MRRGTGIVWLVALAAVLIAAAPVRAEMTVHFIDVGQGGAVFIQKDGQTILYDCADTFADDAVLGYLAAHDVTTIDLLVISHAHKDHMGSCPAVLKAVTVRRVYHNGSTARTDTWQNFLKALEAIETVRVIEEDVEEDGLQILVAYDSRGARFASEANNSLLLRLVDGAIWVLLTGDCEAPCEREVSQTSNVSAHVLNVGHHGSEKASSTAFLKKVKPTTAVIQAGLGNQFKHPKPAVLKRLRAVGASIYRTDRHGAIVIRSTGTHYRVETDK